MGAFSMATITEDLYNGVFYPQFPGNYQASQNLNVVTLTFTIDGTNLKENDGYSLWLIEEDDMKQDTDIVANTPCGFKFSGKDMSDEATMTIANGKMTVDFELRLAGTYVMIASSQGGGYWQWRRIFPRPIRWNAWAARCFLCRSWGG